MASTPTLRSSTDQKQKVDLAVTAGYASSDEFSISSNPFLDRKVADHYRELYNKAEYECRHVFDPDLEWTEAEEKAIVRKIDWHVAAWACIMFFALNVDRGNIKQAISDNMLGDLRLTTNDYNYGQTIFYVSFLLAELPSQLISKKIGPDRWIPIQMCLWSIVASSQAALTGRASFFACRSMMGILEGGFIPDLVLWLSYFYTSGELSVRLSWFWTAHNMTTAVNALMAYGLLHMAGVSGLSGWCWLFLIEGLITFVIGVASFFMMPASAVQTKSWFRPNGWFSDRETGIVVNRVLRDDPSKGDMNNRMGISPKLLWEAITDFDLWPIYAIGLIAYIPQNPPGQYLTLSLRHLGFNPFQTNLLTIPSTVASCFTLLALTWFSERVNERSFVSSLQNFWLLPCLIAIRCWSGAQVEAWHTFALITVLLSYPYCHAIVVSWASRNSGSVRTRSVSAALYNMTVQMGNIVSSNIYREADKPKYRRGNDILIALNLLAIGLFFFAKFYYKARNASRAKKWDSMSVEQREEYLQTTKDEGNKRLDFRFAT